MFVFSIFTKKKQQQTLKLDYRASELVKMVQFDLVYFKTFMLWVIEGQSY